MVKKIEVLKETQLTVKWQYKILFFMMKVIFRFLDVDLNST